MDIGYCYGREGTTGPADYLIENVQTVRKIPPFLRVFVAQPILTILPLINANGLRALGS